MKVANRLVDEGILTKYETEGSRRHCWELTDFGRRLAYWFFAVDTTYKWEKYCQINPNMRDKTPEFIAESDDWWKEDL